ncbi:putative glycosidase [Candidatus Promineifilum breve]|uniref:Glycosidase n=1 Tax=Candidatus Promineifilum breve TaxID=1806508 RepID=A0A160T0I5_9CHLR|nr:glycoside hydrolase family 13 protein [Candidatus Promineifilum breve]CUS01935.1 putative glycosidase [Candidatus Promineifilum breve]
MNALLNLPDWLSTIHHDGSQKYVSALYPRLGETVRLRLRVSPAAGVRRVVLRAFPDGEQAFTLMSHTATTPAAQWWEADLVIDEPITHYRFIIDAADGLWHYSAAGATAHVPLDATDFRIIADYHAPDWLESAVFYQIFPDRFANGDPGNDPQPSDYEYRGQRPKTYPWEAPPDPDHPFPLVFYGGDLAGIEARLDYLADLGVNALYLNPVFHALSNHKYDVADYDRVDPHFGGDEALIALRRALSARGMRYILDIVPNHCGYWHPWFQDALTNQTAAEAEFFTFRRHPDDYATWLGVWTLPKLNYRSQELRRRVYDGPEAVFRRWLRPPFSADGWRVDVANMLGRQGATQVGLDVSRGIRRAVKETNGDSYLLGEHFFDATAQLQSDQWDGVMNYGGFTQPLLYWLSGYRQGAHGFTGLLSAPHWPTAALAETWRSRLAVVPWAIARQQYNLLDSHDTPRIRTTLGENDALHRLAVTILMTFPGVPGLYYGDEIGLTDLPALAARGCMVWDETRWNRPLHRFHRDLIQLRRRSPALQRGGFQLLAVEPDTIAYQRESVDERIIVVAHRGENPRPAGVLDVAHGGVADEARFVDWASGAEFVVEHGALALPSLPQGAIMLQAVS